MPGCLLTTRQSGRRNRRAHSHGPTGLPGPDLRGLGNREEKPNTHLTQGPRPSLAWPGMALCPQGPGPTPSAPLPNQLTQPGLEGGARAIVSPAIVT